MQTIWLFVLAIAYLVVTICILIRSKKNTNRGDLLDMDETEVVVEHIISECRLSENRKWITEDKSEFVHPILGNMTTESALFWARVRTTVSNTVVYIEYAPFINGNARKWASKIAKCFSRKKGITVYLVKAESRPEFTETPTTKFRITI